jgi:NAD(P)H-dependent FMN reductase
MKVAVIVGSTRPGRKTPAMTRWVTNELQKLPDVEIEVLDLADYNLPFFDEPVSPRYNPNRTPNAAARQWLDKLQATHAFIVITPEYNHSIPAVLKNAFDYLDWQVAKKPFGIVSHGVVGGARAAEHLRNVISEVQAVSVPSFVAFTTGLQESFNEEGDLTEAIRANPHGPHMALENLVQELAWYARVLKAAREQV